MIEILITYDRVVVECLLLFLVFWFGQIFYISSETRFAKCKDWQDAIPPINRTHSWLVYGFSIGAIGYLVWFGLAGISIAYLIASPGLLIGMFLSWRRGEHVLGALPVNSSERKTLRYKSYLYATLGFLGVLGFLFAVNWLGF